MTAQWEEILKQRRMEGSPGQFEVMRRVLELVLHELLSQGKRVKSLKEKKTISGWSVEDMKEELNVAVKEDAEELKKWRELSQSENRPKLKEFGSKNGRGISDQLQS